MAELSRRDLFKRSAATGAGIVAGGGALAIVTATGAGAIPPGGYGALVADPAGLLDLPPGFSYRILSRSVDYPGVEPNRLPTDDPVPGGNDGMAAFGSPTRRVTLVRNHELEDGDGSVVPKTDAPVYDPSPEAPGGTTNLVINRSGELVEEYVSLAGTVNNCAGGRTPWSTWLTCEEDTSIIDGTPHGWVFEVDPQGIRTDARPITGMGRFEHEAVAVDPVTLIAYMTEDAGDYEDGDPNGLLYRFVPTGSRRRYGVYHEGGLLQAMSSASVRQLDEVKTVGTVLSDLTWVDVPDPSAATTDTRLQFDDSAITRSRKLEGMFWDKGVAWFVTSYSDTPGNEHNGQVWRYEPAQATLTLVAYFPVGEIFDGPDNITTSPHGGLFLCEDGDGPQYVVGLDEQGVKYPFAENKLLFSDDGEDGISEFAGACFSPDGRSMYLNVQGPGITYAITGPWTGGPSPVIPEAPTAVLLPLGALAVGGGALWLRNRRAGIAPAR